MKVSSYGIFELARQNFVKDLVESFKINPQELEVLLFTTGIQTVILYAGGYMKKIDDSQKNKRSSAWFTDKDILDIQIKSFEELKKIIEDKFALKDNIKFNEQFSNFITNIKQEAELYKVILYKSTISALDVAYCNSTLAENNEMLQMKMLSASLNIISPLRNKFAEAFLNTSDPLLRKAAEDNYNILSMQVKFLEEVSKHYRDSLSATLPENSFTLREIKRRETSTQSPSL